MGNNYVFHISEIDNVVFCTFEGNELIYKEVRHVPDLRLNLISTDKLMNMDTLASSGNVSES